MPNSAKTDEEKIIITRGNKDRVIGALNSNPATPTSANAVSSGNCKVKKQTVPRRAPQWMLNKNGVVFMEPEIKEKGSKWYVEYTVVSNGIKIRHRESRQVNRIKDLDERRKAILSLRNKITQELFDKQKAEEEKLKPQALEQALLSILEFKKTYADEDTIKFYKTPINKFSKFMSSNYGSVMIADVKTEHINHYLIFCMMEGNKARTRNNDLAVLRTLFGELVDQKLVQSNPCSKIKMLYTKSETHVAYTDKQVREIRDWLKENQPYTYFFCKFIAHPFLRLKETRKLRVRDIDFDTGIVTLTAKTSKTQKKIKWLSKDLMRDIKRMEIQNYPEHYFVFSSEQCPGEKQIGKSYFSKRFRKVKKIFGLSRLHTMYGLRHSIVSQLLRNGAPWHEVMKHTGHTTMAAFQKYARSLGTEEPKDLSEFVSVKF